MSDLPRYTRTPKVDESETEALVKKARGSFDLEDEEEQAPSYPPRAGPSGSGLKNVTYEFDPVYPMEGDHQHVLGVLGRDKEVGPSIARYLHIIDYKVLRWVNIRKQSYLFDEHLKPFRRFQMTGSSFTPALENHHLLGVG